MMIIPLSDYSMPLLAELRWEGDLLQGCLWTLLITLASYFIYRLLKQEQQLVSRPVGLALLILRSLILLLLLVTLWKPAFINTYSQQRIGKLVVALDVSQSMQTRDVHASTPEKLRWARALEWVTPETEIASTTPLESKAETEEGVQEAPPSEILNENLDPLFERLSGLSRADILSRTLERQESSFLDRLSQQHELEFLNFAGDAILTSSPVEAKSITDEATQENNEELQPEATDLNQVQQKTIQFTGTQPVTGLVIFTDGQHNEADDPLELTSSLKQLDIPIYPVLVGSEQRPADIILHQVTAPPAVYLNDESTVSINVETIDIPNQEVQVEFYHQGELIEQQSFVSAPDHQSTKTLTFTLQTATADQHHYEIVVQTNSNEFTAENNRQHFTQQVLDNTIHVLLIDNNPRWEFRFLHNALERDERIELQTILLTPPLLDSGAQPLSTPFTKEIKLNPDFEQSLFAGHDLLILGDISTTLLSNSLSTDQQALFYEQLKQFVSEEGKTLILLPGSNVLQNWFMETTLNELSPLSDPYRIEPQENVSKPLPLGMPLLPTSSGYETSFIQLADQAPQNIAVWQRLPGQFGAYTGTPKPAAETLLEAFPNPNQTGKAVMLYHQYGQGQVVWMGIEGTWRWRRRVGDKFHHRFWGQVARWSTQSKLSVETDLVRFGPERPEGIPGQPIRLHAHFASTLLDQLKDLNPQIAVYLLPHRADEEPILKLPLLSYPSRRQSMTTVVENLQEGDYEFVLELDDRTLFPEEIVAPYVVRAVPSREETETIANRALLTQLADQTGGKLFELDQLHEIPDIIKPGSATQNRIQQTHLWTHPFWLASFIILLASEWLLRKWHGLP
ncbi:MAG: hypothetical protein R3C11_17600 [Planctomycetaceae bacterium]